LSTFGSAGERKLQGRCGTTKRAAAFYQNQVLDYLTDEMYAFIARQEMVFVATADAKGECDCSFRAGLPGFVRVLDPKRLAYPEYRGNGVMASLGNILENSHIGMIFVDFFHSTVGLHVNGRASVLENSELAGRLDLPEEARRDLALSGGRKPERWVVVDVEEAYIHCSKHIPMLRKIEKTIHWGTDDEARKGGDYFRVKQAHQDQKSGPAVADGDCAAPESSSGGARVEPGGSSGGAASPSGPA